MESQTIINLLATAVLSMSSWIILRQREELKELRQHDSVLTARVQQVELLVAGEYVKRSDYYNDIQRIFDKLDAISDKLDGKADK